MDLLELSERTGIPRRKLRYVVDHQLVPGLKIELAENEVGRPRKFHDDVGFALVCAVRLLQLGMKPKKIRWFLGGLAQLDVGGKPLIPLLFSRFQDMFRHKGAEFEAFARLGDGVNVRIDVPTINSYSTRWVAPSNPAPLAKSYKPVVEVVLDLGKILWELLSER